MKATRDPLNKLMAGTKRLFWRDTPRKIIEKTGLRPYVEEIWDTIIYATSDDEYTLEVAGIETDFYTQNRNEVRLFYPEFSERSFLAEVVHDIEQSDVFYDIGAHVGIYTCMISQILDPDRVVAVEPHPASTSRIRENLSLNETDARVQECFLSDRNGQTRLELNEDVTGERIALPAKETNGGVTRPVSRGDSLIEDEDLPRPTIMKIDVDGNEKQVLDGLSSVLDDVRKIYLEVHPELLENHGSSESEIKQILREYGYEWNKFSSLGNRYHISAGNPS